MNYYKRHLGDYAKDTGFLSTYQHGVYALLLDWYYSNEKPIPIAIAYRIVRARSGPEKRAVDEVISAFFDVSKDPMFAVCNRADLEISKCKIKGDVNRLIAIERESTKRARNVDSTCAVGKPSHKPLAISHKKEKDADLLVGLPAQLVKDFLKIRKAKRLPLTQTALDGIKREAEKAGYTLEQAVKVCCEKGWASFDHSWTGASRPAPAQREIVPPSSRPLK